MTKRKKSKKRIFIKTKLEIFSNIKARSKNKKVRNEISEDLEKINLTPEDLILIEYIDKKISESKK
ncbi:MAG: hypothetical protein EAX89_07525 [Candidatus Lokiarchaeota archaeon]|nr:hypothetical protein [Candidatus Lokiarchaeota archaeon]